MKNFTRYALLAVAALLVAAPVAAQQRFDLPLACAQDVDLNTDETDKTISIPNGSGYYLITRMVAFNPSTTLAASSAEIGLFSAATGTGETIVTPTTMTGLTAAAKFKSFDIAQDDLITASTLYIHTDDAHGTAATVDVCVYGVFVGGNATIGL